MFFLNLGLGEFLALWGAISGLVFALYLLDRQRKKKKVATLRFFVAAERPPESPQRRAVQQPLSLLLQLLAILCLLAAIGQLHWGERASATRDHVLVLDQSAWMMARLANTRPNGQAANGTAPNGLAGVQTLMQEAQRQAIVWARSLPSQDRVMLLRAGASASPATSFSEDRAALETAILQTQPGLAALDLRDALASAQRLVGSTGEIVLASALRSNLSDLPPANPGIRNLRLLPVQAAVRNLGLRQVVLRRMPGSAQAWEIFVSVRNSGNQTETVPVNASFGSAPVASTRLTIAPGEEASARMEFSTKAAGWVDVALQVRDAIARDNVARVEIAPAAPVRLAVISSDPGRLKPLLQANAALQVSYLNPGLWRAGASPAIDADVLLVDGWNGPATWKQPTIWIMPTANPGAPVAKRAENLRVTGWSAVHPAASGLATSDLLLPAASVFRPSPNVAVVAESAEGPVVLASSGEPKALYFGFDPAEFSLRGNLAAPLLMANALEWLAPRSVAAAEAKAQAVGLAQINLPASERGSAVEVVDAEGNAVPFSRQEDMVSLFGQQSGMLRLRAGGFESTVALTLPDTGERAWEPAASIPKGLARGRGNGAAARDLWPWLAGLGALLFAIEWWFYGQSRATLASAGATATTGKQSSSKEAVL